MSEEYFDVINENNEIIGKATRKECHDNNLLHRGVAIFVFNQKGELLLQKRSQLKDLYKGWWTSSASGHLDLGEDYQEAAKRELKEELGVELTLSELPCIIEVRQEKDSENGKLFVAKSNGPFSFSKEEIDSIHFFSIKEIQKMIQQKEKFTPFFLANLKVYLQAINSK